MSAAIQSELWSSPSGEADANPTETADRLLSLECVLRAEGRERVRLLLDRLWSATRFSDLARDAREAERHNRLHPLAEGRSAFS